MHEMDRFRHEALFYADPDGFLAGTVPFIRGGLEAGEPVLVVESPEKIALLHEALGPDSDNVNFADMAAVGANPARIIPAWQDFVNRHGAPRKRLRGIGEPIWNGRTADELVECQRHESLLNVAFGLGRSWWLLCPYDTTQLASAVIDEARRSHEFVTEGRHAQHSAQFVGIDAPGAPFDVPLPEPAGDAVELDFKPESMLALRRVVARNATAAGLNASRATELVTSVNEVATNSIVHGGGGGTLRLWREPNSIVVEIRDRGAFDRPLIDRVQPGEDPSAPRGLWLANQLCDLVQIRNFKTETAVRLHKHIKPGLRVIPAHAHAAS